MIRIFVIVSMVLIQISISLSANPVTASRTVSGKDSVLTLTFLGDLMAHRPNFTMDNYHKIYESVKQQLLVDDLTFINLEAPIDNERQFQTYPRFNVHDSYVRAAIDSGIEVFSVANNHINDWGLSSIIGTQRAFDRLAQYAQQKQNKIYASGLRDGPNNEFEFLTIDRPPWKIGFVAITQFVNNNDSTAEYVQIVDYRNQMAIRNFIQNIKAVKENFDILIVSYHGGVEYQPHSNAKKQEFFYQLAEAGADVIWGHHPHVLQKWERYTTEQGRESLIMHSLGNFISAQTWFVQADEAHSARAATGDSVILTIEYEKHNGAPVLQTLRSIPISNVKLQNNDIVVRKYHAILNDSALTSEWRAYYSDRFQLLSERFNF